MKHVQDRRSSMTRVGNPREWDALKIENAATLWRNIIRLLTLNGDSCMMFTSRRTKVCD